MYNELIEALDLAGKDDSVITVMTGEVLCFTFTHPHGIQRLQILSHPPLSDSKGNGDYYCSGNDLNNFTKIPEGGVQDLAKQSGELLK